jgi:hypothetical protein
LKTPVFESNETDDMSVQKGVDDFIGIMQRRGYQCEYYLRKQTTNGGLGTGWVKYFCGHSGFENREECSTCGRETGWIKKPVPYSIYWDITVTDPKITNAHDDKLKEVNEKVQKYKEQLMKEYGLN